MVLVKFVLTLVPVLLIHLGIVGVCVWYLPRSFGVTYVCIVRYVCAAARSLLT